MQTNYLIYALIVVGVFTAYMAIVNIFRKDRMRDRVQQAGGVGMKVEEEKRSSALAEICAGLLSLTGVDVKAQKPLQLLMLQAGISSPHAVTYFLFFKRIMQPVFMVAGGILFIQILVSTNMPITTKMKDMILALILLAVGMSGASLYINNKKQHRQQKLLYAFPEALDLLLVCIESGLGLDAALSRVCSEVKKSHVEVAQELDRTRLELTMLSDRTQALQNLAERAEIVPFKSLVASLIQTEKFGTSLLDTLRVLSEEQRVTRLLNAENRAARISVLITIPLIICTLPALIIVILAPPIVRVMDQGGIFGSKN